MGKIVTCFHPGLHGFPNRLWDRHLDAGFGARRERWKVVFQNRRHRRRWRLHREPLRLWDHISDKLLTPHLDCGITDHEGTAQIGVLAVPGLSEHRSADRFQLTSLP